jgi:hypothetical protein
VVDAAGGARRICGQLYGDDGRAFDYAGAVSRLCKLGYG